MKFREKNDKATSFLWKLPSGVLNSEVLRFEAVIKEYNCFTIQIESTSTFSLTFHEEIRLETTVGLHNGGLEMDWVREKMYQFAIWKKKVCSSLECSSSHVVFNRKLKMGNITINFNERSKPLLQLLGRQHSQHSGAVAKIIQCNRTYWSLCYLGKSSSSQSSKALSLWLQF